MQDQLQLIAIQPLQFRRCSSLFAASTFSAPSSPSSRLLTSCGPTATNPLPIAIQPLHFLRSSLCAAPYSFHALQRQLRTAAPKILPPPAAQSVQPNKILVGMTQPVSRRQNFWRPDRQNPSETFRESSRILKKEEEARFFLKKVLVQTFPTILALTGAQGFYGSARRSKKKKLQSLRLLYPKGYILERLDVSVRSQIFFLWWRC